MKDSLDKWLASPIYPKAIFHHRFYLGAAKTFYHISEAMESKEPIIGGMDFFTKPRKTFMWNPFPSCLFFAPEKCYEGTIETPEVPFTPKPFFIVPTKQEYQEHIKKFKENTSLEKVVLSRTCELEKDDISFAEILRNIYHMNREGHFFVFAVDDNNYFFGNSPEILFSRTHRSIISEAVAGTALFEEKENLFKSQKDQKEYRYVESYIEQTLSPYTIHLEKETFSPQIRKAAHLAHLYNRFHGILPSNVTDFDLIKALHPTPALGGFPKKEALDWIYAAEKRDRGWYGAPFGLRSEDQSTFIVAIRSYLLRGSLLLSFTGSGCIKESNEEHEWQELGDKLYYKGKAYV